MASNGTATRIMGFYGYSDSGKTTLIEKAISYLKQAGYAVAAIKQTNKSIHVDQEGKDTGRFRAAGAEAIALCTPAATSLIFNSELEIRKLAAIMIGHHKPDFILVEGAREDWIPKIRIGKIGERANTVWSYNGSFDDLINVILEKGEPCTLFK